MQQQKRNETDQILRSSSIENKQASTNELNHARSISVIEIPYANIRKNHQSKRSDHVTNKLNQLNNK